MQARRFFIVLWIVTSFFLMSGQSLAFGVKCEPFLDIKAKHDADGYVWIDCRTPDKYTISHETGAINIEIEKVVDFIVTNYHELNTKIIIFHDECDTVCLCCALARLGYTEITSVAVPGLGGGGAEKEK